MVWFQCEDCGENLKKPKLPGHFRICSASKLSCIDCGTTFNQQTVQGHTQCVTEMEKYGPKTQAKTPTSSQTKTNAEQKQDLDFDVNAGLSSRPPWFCSLCNTQVTSKQTLLLHAEGKKHKAKARAFHSANKPSNESQSTRSEKSCANGHAEVANGLEKVDHPKSAATPEKDMENPPERHKRKLEPENGAPETKDGRESDLKPDEATVGEILKKRKSSDANVLNKEHSDKMSNLENGQNLHIKWKKLIRTILKQSPNGALKLKKLQKLVIKSLEASGFANEDKDHLKSLMLDKVSSSSHFELNGKLVHLVPKCS
ncbi:UBP1-associated proteins 1C [Nymphaea thermarum]|nr:UBP1-associated proteins 1C [Nymphaea thermarum]